MDRGALPWVPAWEHAAGDEAEEPAEQELPEAGEGGDADPADDAEEVAEAGDAEAGPDSDTEPVPVGGDNPLPAWLRRRWINPWVGAAAAGLLLVVGGVFVGSPLTMVSSYHVATSDLPRLSDPEPAQGTSVTGGGPVNLALPPAGGVVPSPVSTLPEPIPSLTLPGAVGPAVPQTVGADGIPSMVLSAYQNAAAVLARREPGCHLPWELLAGIGKVESDHAQGGNVTANGTMVSPLLGPRLDGTNGTELVPDTDQGRYDYDTQYDRAVGPMQFIPSTWREYGMAANGIGIGDPENIFDASLTAGRYLCAGGRDMDSPADVSSAIFSYNPSTDYVNTVEAWFAYYRAGVQAVPDVTQAASTPPVLGPPVSTTPPTVPSTPGTGSNGGTTPGGSTSTPPSGGSSTPPGTPAPSTSPGSPSPSTTAASAGTTPKPSTS